MYFCRKLRQWPKCHNNDNEEHDNKSNYYEALTIGRCSTKNFLWTVSLHSHQHHEKDKIKAFCFKTWEPLFITRTWSLFKRLSSYRFLCNKLLSYESEWAVYLPHALVSPPIMRKSKGLCSRTSPAPCPLLPMSVSQVSLITILLEHFTHWKVALPTFILLFASTHLPGIYQPYLLNSDFPMGISSAPGVNPFKYLNIKIKGLD